MINGNIYHNINKDADSELMEILHSGPNARIERIVSHGESTPIGEWYDQEWDEWVILLEGYAELRFEGQDELIIMKKGDYIHIPAHKRHRVEKTDAIGNSVWIAVHFKNIT